MTMKFNIIYMLIVSVIFMDKQLFSLNFYNRRTYQNRCKRGMYILATGFYYMELEW
jgi:hypothetical protein